MLCGHSKTAGVKRRSKDLNNLYLEFAMALSLRTWLAMFLAKSIVVQVSCHASVSISSLKKQWLL